MSNQFSGLPVEVKGHGMHLSTPVILLMGKRAPVLCGLGMAHRAFAKSGRS